MASFWAVVDDMAQALDSFLESEQREDDDDDDDGIENEMIYGRHAEILAVNSRLQEGSRGQMPRYPVDPLDGAGAFSEAHDALERRGKRLHALEEHMNEMRGNSSDTAKLARELSAEVNSARYRSSRGCLCF